VLVVAGDFGRAVNGSQPVPRPIFEDGVLRTIVSLHAEGRVSHVIDRYPLTHVISTP